MIIDGKKIWAVEWHPKLKQTNVNFLSEVIEDNLQFIITGDGNTDWLLVGLADSPEDADKIAATIEEKLG